MFILVMHYPGSRVKKTPGVEKQLPLNTTVCLAGRPRAGGGSPYAQQPPCHYLAIAEAAELGEPLATAASRPAPKVLPVPQGLMPLPIPPREEKKK